MPSPFDPIWNGISNTLIGIGQWAAPTPPRFVPTFQEVQVFPPHMPDGNTPNDGTHFQLFKLKEYATQETAEWVRREFSGKGLVARPGYDNEYKVYRDQLLVDFGTGDNGGDVHIIAGHIAWYFTRKSSMDAKDGFWDPSTMDATIMSSGRERAKMLIDSAKREH